MFILVNSAKIPGNVSTRHTQLNHYIPLDNICDWQKEMLPMLSNKS